MRCSFAGLFCSFSSLVLIAGCEPPVLGGASHPPDVGTGNPSRQAESSMPPCGTKLAEFRTVAAYSNDDKTGGPESCGDEVASGYQYQCVELVMRYYLTHYGFRWWGHAKDVLANAPRDKMDVYSNGDGAHPPVPGDVITWVGTDYGHVAIVTAVRADAIDVLEQNVEGNGRATVAWDGKSFAGRWRSATPQGWAHPKAAPGGGTNPECAASDYNGRQVWTCTAGTLRKCDGSGKPVEQACANGCQNNGPGNDDTCSAAAPSPKPSPECANYDYQGRQYWTCVASTLKKCDGGGQVIQMACANGCQSNGLGNDDTCKPAGPQPSPECANYAYQGKQYWTCVGGTTLKKCDGSGQVIQMACANGCQSNGLGNDDTCKSGGVSWSCASSAYNGQQYWTCSGGALYKCANNVPQKTSCGRGCFGAGLGRDDLCVEAAGGWSCANSAYNGKQYWTCSGGALYKCDAQGGVIVRCPSGCVSKGLGNDDACK